MNQIVTLSGLQNTHTYSVQSIYTSICSKSIDCAWAVGRIRTIVAGTSCRILKHTVDYHGPQSVSRWQCFCAITSRHMEPSRWSSERSSPVLYPLNSVQRNISDVHSAVETSPSTRDKQAERSSSLQYLGFGVSAPMPFTSMYTRGSRWSLNGVLPRPAPYTVYTMKYQWCTHHTPCIFETPPSIKGKQAGYSSSSLQWLSCVDYQTPCILTSWWSLSGVFRTIYSVQYSDVHPAVRNITQCVPG